MASLLALSAELKLCIIEQLDLTSTSFITYGTTPSQDLLNLSRVCRVLRTLSLPFMLKRITLLNDSKSGSSILAVLHGAHAALVRHVHYVGIMAMPAMPQSSEVRYHAMTEPCPDHLPKSVERALSSLAKLPNLKQVTVQFACAKTADEDEDIYRSSYGIFKELETDEQVLESEKMFAFRSLMERSYRALSHTLAGSIKHLELKNVVAKKCSAWKLTEFHSMLQGLSSFTISVRGGDNGSGWQINPVKGYLNFISELDDTFFRHLSNVKHFKFAATRDAPPGIEGGMNNAALPLLGHHMPQLESLSLEHIFISGNLSAFIIAHCRTLESVGLNHCYSGWNEGDAICWGELFSNIASNKMRSLRIFYIATTDLERMQPNFEDWFGYDDPSRAHYLRQLYPNRRMLDYKYMDDKYYMVFGDDNTAFERFETGSDHSSWQLLCQLITKNLGGNR